MENSYDRYKFRAWDKRYNTMRVVNGLQLGNEHIQFVRLEGNRDNLAQIGSLELMQFTGLKDKNGKDIYENDIITLKNNNCTVRGVVRPENYARMIMEIQKWIDGRDGGTVEVIGDIYTTTELLSEVK